MRQAAIEIARVGQREQSCGCSFFKRVRVPVAGQTGASQPEKPSQRKIFKSAP